MTGDQLKQMSERSAFEKWASEAYGDDDDDSGVSLERRGEGYAYSGIDDAWQGWQAALAAQQSLITRLESMHDAQEVLIGKYIAAQREAEAEVEALKADIASTLDSLIKESVGRCEADDVIADIKAILMDHAISYLVVRLNNAMKRIDAYENRSAGRSADTEGGE